MSSPILPDQFKALAPGGNPDMCTLFKSWLRFITLFYQWFASVYKADGTLSADFLSMIGVPTATNVGTALPLAPTGLNATSGLAGSVQISWGASANSTSYSIWRHTADDSSAASQIGTSTSTVYVDSTAVPGTSYYYWAKGVNVNGSSGFSNSDEGSCIAVVDTIYTATSTYTVLAGITQASFRLWAGGGGGGYGSFPYAWMPWGLPGATYTGAGGGGGGGGGYTEKLLVAVVEGDVIQINVGAGGAIGMSGGETSVYKNAVLVAKASGGGPGANASGASPGNGGSGGTGYADSSQTGASGSAGNTGSGGAGGTSNPDAIRNPSGYSGSGGAGGLGASGAAGLTMPQAGAQGMVTALYEA